MFQIPLMVRDYSDDDPLSTFCTTALWLVPRSPLLDRLVWFIFWRTPPQCRAAIRLNESWSRVTSPGCPAALAEPSKRVIQAFDVGPGIVYSSVQQLGRNCTRCSSREPYGLIRQASVVHLNQALTVKTWTNSASSPIGVAVSVSSPLWLQGQVSHVLKCRMLR